jgi:competence protein ComEC
MSRLAFDARERGVAIRLCRWGERFGVGELPVRILAPSGRRSDLGPNDGSVVVLVGRAPYRLLVPGDLESDGEALLVGSPLPLRAEAMMLSHHGSRSGSSADLLERVRPRHAIVSCGARNRFGHPHPAACRRVRNARATLWRTDLDGMIDLVGRDGTWRVSPTRRGR